MPTQQEIDEQLNRAAVQTDKGGSRYHGMTFEQGVDAALRWMTDLTDEVPIPDAAEEE